MKSSARPVPADNISVTSIALRLNRRSWNVSINIVLQQKLALRGLPRLSLRAPFTQQHVEAICESDCLASRCLTGCIPLGCLLHANRVISKRTADIASRSRDIQTRGLQQRSNAAAIVAARNTEAIEFSQGSQFLQTIRFLSNVSDASMKGLAEGSCESLVTGHFHRLLLIKLEVLGCVGLQEIENLINMR